MRDVLVLCYHAVSERWPSELAVSPELLDEQITAPRAARLPRDHVHPCGHRPALAPHAGDHLRRRVPLDARAGGSGARPPRRARHRLRADRLGRPRGAHVLARDRGVVGRPPPRRAPLSHLGRARRARPSRAGRWARTRARIRGFRRSTTPRSSASCAGSRELITERLGQLRVDRLPVRRLRRAGGARGGRRRLPRGRHAHRAAARGAAAELAAGGGVPGQPAALPQAEDLARAALAGGGRRSGCAAACSAQARSHPGVCVARAADWAATRHVTRVAYTLTRGASR